MVIPTYRILLLESNGGLVIKRTEFHYYKMVSEKEIDIWKTLNYPDRYHMPFSTVSCRIRFIGI